MICQTIFKIFSSMEEMIMGIDNINTVLHVCKSSYM